MGKALVVNGLSVSKPLMRVHLYMTQADIILADYLGKNISINDVEKDALKTFVNTLYEANLWGKMKYFYPIIGETVSDALLNVIDPLGDDIFKNADENTIPESIRNESHRAWFTANYQSYKFTYTPGEYPRVQ